MHNSLKYLNLLLMLSVSSFCLMAQAPAIEWQKSMGGSEADHADVIQPTADGGYIIAGLTRSNDGDIVGNHGEEDYWIVKLDNLGVIQWQKSLGGSEIDHAFSIKPTADNGYIVAGISQSEDGDVTSHQGSSTFFDYWIVKLDNTGAVQWQKSLGGTNHDIASSIEPTADGGYIVAGRSDSYNEIPGHHGIFDAWIVKLDDAGDMQWQKALGGAGNDAAKAIRQTNDGAYIVAGYSNSGNGDVTGNHGSFDCWIVKLDTLGTIQWQKSLGGSEYEEATAVELTDDGGYIVAGFSKSNDGDVSGNHGAEDYWLVKTNDAGIIEWQKSLGGSGKDIANCVQPAPDGGYLVAGYSSSNDENVSGNHGASDYWIVKLDILGAIQWQKSIGGSEIEQATSVMPTADAGCVVAGFSKSNDGDVSNNHGGNDCWIVKLEAEATGMENVFAEKIRVYPNPVEEVLYFSEKLQDIRIFSILGAAIADFEPAIQIKLKGLPFGTYILEARTIDGKLVTQIFIKK